MPGTEGFLELAAIGGVFVGFAALIAVRSGGPSGPELAYMRGVVTIGMLSVVAALAPVTLARYDLTEHGVWALSSGVALIGGIVLFATMARTPEYRTNVRSEVRETRARPAILNAIDVAAYVLYMLVVVLTPIVILLGVAPELDAPLYFTLVVLLLLGAGWTLLYQVYAQHAASS